MSGSWWRTDAAQWHAHGWHLDLRGDELAEIRHGDRRMLRAVRAVVRDRGWQTVPVVVSSVDRTPEALVLHLRHEGPGAALTSTLRVTASANELTIAWDAVNEQGFDTCRAGLVLLHPASDAGRDATVVHPDGSAERVAFPTDISPHQPVKDIAALHVDGLAAFSFEGDVFEMEDQRNWSDASFKTYSRPLALPYPYRLETGETVRQSISIRPTRAVSAAAPKAPAVLIELRPGGMFPAVGVEASTAPDPVPASSAGSFRVVELDLRTSAWSAALARAAADGRPLDVRLVTDGSGDALDAAARALAGLDVLRITPFGGAHHISDAPLLTALRSALDAAGVDAAVLAGARSHFTELNREQERIPRDVDGISVNTTPLFHALDTEQLVEAVAIQRLIAEQAVRVSDGLPVHIGPVSLRPRFNNVATVPEPKPTREDLSDGYGAQFTGAADERQTAPELAAWVVASAAALAVPGVRSLSWFETWGARGLENAAGRTPAADVVDALVSLEGGELLTAASPDELTWAVGARVGDATVVLAANLDRVSRRFSVQLPAGDLEQFQLGSGDWIRLTA